MGTVAECRAYTGKTGKWLDDPKSKTAIPSTFEEFGVLPADPGQGFRSDLEEIGELIVAG